MRADPKASTPRRECKRGHDLANAPVRNGSRHCRECASLRRSEWKRKVRLDTATITCPDCGESRQVSRLRQWKLVGKRCRACTQRRRYTTEGNPLKGRGGKPCAECGAKMAGNIRVKHCSIACRRAHERRVAAGKRPGPSRWSLKLKGENRCRACGGDAHHLHHIVPRSRWPGEARDDLRNGMPLCSTCHSAWHRHLPGAPSWTHIRRDEWEYITDAAPIDPEWFLRNYPLIRTYPLIREEGVA